MSGNQAVLPDQTVEVLRRFPAPTPFGSSPGGPRPLSAMDLQARLPGLLLAWDWIGIALVGLLADFILAQPGSSRLTHYLDIVLAATITVNCLRFIRGYCVRGMRRIPVQMAKASLAWAVGFGSLMAIGSLAGLTADAPSAPALQAWELAWLASGWLLLCTTRWAAGLLLSHWNRAGRLARNVAVIGTGPAAVALARRLQARSDEANVVGVFVDEAAGTGLDCRSLEGETLSALIRGRRIDEVLLALPYHPAEALGRHLKELAATRVEVKIVPGFSGLGIPIQGFGFVGGVPALTVHGQPLTGWGAPFKRAEDIVLTSLLIILMAPVLLLIAVLIKIDSRGPVIFRQERHGFNNERFVVFKFRTMHHRPAADPDVPQARRNDPRLTRLGGFLRRTSLDELPQLINVLRGDMSLVGPRPHAIAHNERFGRLIDRYLARHRMKPGLTGWAQVNGWRGETDTIEKMQGRLEHDLFYIANWSPLLDFKVLLMTIPVTVGGTNAY